MRERGRHRARVVRAAISGGRQPLRHLGRPPPVRGHACLPQGPVGARLSRASVAPSRAKDSDLDPVTGVQSWYSRWASDVLGVACGRSSVTGPAAAGAAGDGRCACRSSTARAAPRSISCPRRRSWSRPVDVDDLEAGGTAWSARSARRRCPGTVAVVDQLDGAPCLVARCSGRLERSAGSDNFYRRMYDVDRHPARRGPRAHQPARRRDAAGVRERLQGQRQRTPVAQRAGGDTDARDGHRHRRPVDRHARLVAAQRRVLPAARRPCRPPDRQRAQPRVRHRPRRPAAAAGRSAVGDQRRGAPARHLPRCRGDPAPPVRGLGCRPACTRRRRHRTRARPPRR